jgi:hypothetical protein
MPRIRQFLRRPAVNGTAHRKHWGVEFRSGHYMLSFTTGIDDPCVRIWGISPRTDMPEISHGRPVGRIDATGELSITSDCDQAFLALIDEFETDPEKVVAEYGRKTGRCCFCKLKLTDRRSEEMGYGPVCAMRFQLPWGNKRTKTEE